MANGGVVQLNAAPLRGLESPAESPVAKSIKCGFEVPDRIELGDVGIKKLYSPAALFLQVR